MCMLLCTAHPDESSNAHPTPPEHTGSANHVLFPTLGRGVRIAEACVVNVSGTRDSCPSFSLLWARAQLAHNMKTVVARVLRWGGGACVKEPVAPPSMLVQVTISCHIRQADAE